MAIRVSIEQQESGVFLSKIFLADYQVYLIVRATILEILSKTWTVLTELEHFPIPIHGRKEIQDNLIGRPVYWRERPAIVQDFDGYTGKVVLRPQPPARVFESEPWDKDLGAGEIMASGWVREDLLSQKIHWFRTDNVEDSPSGAADTDRVGSAEKNRS